MAKRTGVRAAGQRETARKKPEAPSREASRDAIRARARELMDKGMPEALAQAVAQGRMRMDEALERLSQRAEVDALMRKHGLSRALATQVVRGEADLEAYLARKRMEAHRAENLRRSCVDDAHAAGAELALLVHGCERVTGRIIATSAYEVTVQPAEGAPRTLHKLDLKLAYHPDDYKKVRRSLRATSDAAAAEPKRKPQDRYSLADKRLFTVMEAEGTVLVTTLEGDQARGEVSWFGRFEFGLRCKGGVEITVFRHALRDFRELS